MPLVRVQCAECSVGFARPHARVRSQHSYCSVECRARGESRKRRCRVETMCAHCGSVFYAVPARPRVYCSMACRDAHRSPPLPPNLLSEYAYGAVTMKALAKKYGCSPSHVWMTLDRMRAAR